MRASNCNSLVHYEHTAEDLPFAVGANGSGKSNFFQGSFSTNCCCGARVDIFSALKLAFCAAIKFVLDADTPTLREEERVKLLHVCFQRPLFLTP